MLSMLKQAIGSRGCSPSAIIASHHDAATIPAKSNNNSGGVRIRSSGYSGTARRRRHHGLLRLPLLRLRLPLAWKRCYYQQRQSTKFTSSPSPRYLAFVSNISPFSLKVESFLRLYDIPYEMVPTFTFSSKGQMPYIRLNSIDGVEIPDSNVIIDFRPPVVLRKVIASLLSARQVVLLSRRLCVTYLILLRVDLSVEHSEQWQNATCLNCYMYASYVVRLQAGTG